MVPDRRARRTEEPRASIAKTPSLYRAVLTRRRNPTRRAPGPKSPLPIKPRAKTVLASLPANSLRELAACAALWMLVMLCTCSVSAVVAMIANMTTFEDAMPRTVEAIGALFEPCPQTDFSWPAFLAATRARGRRASLRGGWHFAKRRGRERSSCRGGRPGSAKYVLLNRMCGTTV